MVKWLDKQRTFVMTPLAAEAYGTGHIDTSLNVQICRARNTLSRMVYAGNKLTLIHVITLH